MNAGSVFPIGKKLSLNLGNVCIRQCVYKENYHIFLKDTKGTNENTCYFLIHIHTNIQHHNDDYL